MTMTREEKLRMALDLLAELGVGASDVLRAPQSPSGTTPHPVQPGRDMCRETLAQRVSRYVEDKKVSGEWRGNTLVNTPATLMRFAEWMPEIEPAQITRRQIEAYRGHLQSLGLADSTVRRSLAVLRAFLERLTDLEEIPSNPAARVRQKVRTVAKKPRRALPEAGLGQLLGAFEERAGRDPRRFLPRIVCETGLRPGEVTQLAAGDVEDLWVDTSGIAERGGQLKTSSSVRRVPCNASTARRIRAAVPRWGSVDRAYRHISMMFSGFLREQGMGEEFSLYSCRYRAAVAMRLAGIDKVYREVVMGHSTAADLTDGLYGAEGVPDETYDRVREALKVS